MPDVTLMKPHTHAGVQYPAGATLRVTPAEARWLASHQVTEPETTPALHEESEHE